jgi:hypothetical protein
LIQNLDGKFSLGCVSIDLKEVQHEVLKKSVSSFEKAVEDVTVATSPLIIGIDKDFSSSNDINLNKLEQIPSITAFQSSINGKFIIIWRLNDETFRLNLFDDINREDLFILCEFIVAFLGKCLDDSHTGESQQYLYKQTF